LSFFTYELKNIFLKIEVKRKKCRAFKTLNNGLLIVLPFSCTGILNLSQFKKILSQSKHHSKPVKKNRTAEADTPRHLHLNAEGGAPLERGVSESERNLIFYYWIGFPYIGQGFLILP
jgi:hypothetical protein